MKVIRQYSDEAWEYAENHYDHNCQNCRFFGDNNGNMAGCKCVNAEEAWNVPDGVTVFVEPTTTCEKHGNGWQPSDTILDESASILTEESWWETNSKAMFF